MHSRNRKVFIVHGGPTCGKSWFMNLLRMQWALVVDTDDVLAASFEGYWDARKAASKGGDQAKGLINRFQAYLAAHVVTFLMALDLVDVVVTNLWGEDLELLTYDGASLRPDVSLFRASGEHIMRKSVSRGGHKIPVSEADMWIRAWRRWASSDKTGIEFITLKEDEHLADRVFVPAAISDRYASKEARADRIRYAVEAALMGVGTIDDDVALSPLVQKVLLGMVLGYVATSRTGADANAKTTAIFLKLCLEYDLWLVEGGDATVFGTRVGDDLGYYEPNVFEELSTACRYGGHSSAARRGWEHFSRLVRAAYPSKRIDETPFVGGDKEVE